MRIEFIVVELTTLVFTMVESMQIALGTLDAPSQAPLAGWNISLSRDWDVLGPFPIQAREQHFMSPAFPLDLSEPYEQDANRNWTSSYADRGLVSWTKARSDELGNLEVTFPDIRWSSLRSTEGWASLQHHTVLRTTLTVYPCLPYLNAPALPRLLVDLKQGSFLTLIPPKELWNSSSKFLPEWHVGNIYDMERSLPSVIDLPAPPSTSQPTTYDLFVSGDYEIRLFGDPRSSGRENPTLKINISVKAELGSVRATSHDVACDFVDGFAFGNALGVGLRSVHGWWIVENVIAPKDAPQGIKLSLLGPHRRLAPSQVKTIPITITQTEAFRGQSLVFSLTLSSAFPEDRPSSFSVEVTLNIRQISQWNEESYETIKASYIDAQTHITSFLVKPPIKPNAGAPKPSIIALHGAGVDILSLPFWANAIPRQNHGWVIMPTGRTAWGLDWHGLSASDAWSTVAALGDILAKRQAWDPWQLDIHAKAVILGHSNGGQGAWYMASRHPDKVLAVIAAAGYLKSQQYVPLTLSRAGHFIDPSLRAVLESSLTPDDNDLFLSNIADMPTLAIHGGDDDNVPTWHTREYFNIIRTWNGDANIKYIEDAGKPHWYAGIFQSEDVLSFLDSSIASNTTRDRTKSFTLTVAHPPDSGSLHGWRVVSLKIPGRLSRLHVSNQNSRLHVKTMNVLRFTIERRMLSGENHIEIDGSKVFAVGDEELITFVSSKDGVWARETSETTTTVTSTDHGRVLNLLRSAAPLTVVIPNPRNSPRALSIALRIAHSLDVYHKLDVDVITDEEANAKVTKNTLPSGNLVVIGSPENLFAQWCIGLHRTEFRLRDGMYHFKGRLLDEPSLGILFTHPHPTAADSMALFLAANDDDGLERALRLFPLRTGISVPDWVFISKDSDGVGAAGIQGAGVWDNTWHWNEAMSWLP